jgi:hypothetical protein
MNVCFQHSILDFANAMTVKQLLAVLQYFEICDQEVASSEGWKDENPLAPMPQHSPPDGSLVVEIWLKMSGTLTTQH